MKSFLRPTAVAALISTCCASEFGHIATQTVDNGGYGALFAPAPTDAPVFELKMRFEKRSVTNVCTEWSILGGYGQPECSNSQTCLFTSAGGLYYEGCGQTSIRYDWITDCWDYPQTQTGTVPISQIWCDATAPKCGFMAFVLQPGYTYFNYGCSTTSYAFIADLVESTTAPTLIGNTGQTLTLSSTTATGASSTDSPATITSTTVVVPPTSSSTSNPIIQQNNKPKTPIGPIVGGVVAGVLLIAIIAFLVWFIMRKRRRDRETKAMIAAQQNQAAAYAAIPDPHRVSEIAGTMMYKPPGGQPGGPQYPTVQPQNPEFYPEKLGAVHTGAQEIGAGGVLRQSAYMENTGAAVGGTGVPSPGSPPPTYTQPQPQQQQQQYQPSPLLQPSGPPPPEAYAAAGQPNPHHQFSELDPQNVVPQQQQQHNSYIPPINLAGGVAPPNELPAGNGPQPDNRGSYSPVPNNVQEMSAGGGVNRPPPSASPRQGAGGFDMSGAPMSEEFHGAELP